MNDKQKEKITAICNVSTEPPSVGPHNTMTPAPSTRIIKLQQPAVLSESRRRFWAFSTSRVSSPQSRQFNALLACTVVYVATEVSYQPMSAFRSLSISPLETFACD